jgi:hypothetical protein
MSDILNMFIYVDMILLDNQLQCLVFIAIIDLSRTYGSTASLIGNALLMFMIYSLIKIKLKMLIFPIVTCKTHLDSQRFQISFIWIEENSYHISREVLIGVRGTIQGHKKEIKITRRTKRIKITMTLHHHLHSSLQKNLWCSNAELLLFLNSSKHASCRHPFWCVSLRHNGLVSIAITIILHPIGCNIISVVILVHLIFFLIGVTEDDDVAIIGWPKKSTVEVTEELSNDLLVP